MPRTWTTLFYMRRMWTSLFYMPRTWTSLFYRELHEQKWRSISLAVIMVSMAAGLIYASDRPGIEDALQILMKAACGGVLGALFIAMGVAGGERSTGTLAFTQALPVPAWRVATVKLAAGTIAILVPAALTGLVIAAWFLILGPRVPVVVPRWEPGLALSSAGELAVHVVAVMGLMVNVFLWTTATGMNRSTEIRAGLGGLIALVAWFVIFFLTLPVRSGSSFLVKFVSLAGPLGPMFLPEILDYSQYMVAVLTGVFLQIAVAVILVGISLVRYSRSSAGPRRQPTSPVAAGDRGAELRAPCKNPLAALAWKQWRESMPFCVAGLVLIPGWTALLVLGQVNRIEDRSAAYLMREAAEMMVLLTMVLGTGIAMVVGVGTFVSEMQPNLLTFWRSRPVSVSQWFFAKYVTGVTAVLVVLLIPILSVALFLFLTRGDAASPDHFLWGLILWLWYLFFAFTASVCLTCLVRQAVYAGIFSLAMILALVLVPIHCESLRWWYEVQTAGQYVAFSACVGTLTLALLLLAWQSVVRDWGWRQ